MSFMYLGGGSLVLFRSITNITNKTSETDKVSAQPNPLNLNKKTPQQHLQMIQPFSLLVKNNGEQEIAVPIHEPVQVAKPYSLFIHHTRHGRLYERAQDVHESH